jgi:mono/diheme cytochrome c family protein
MLFRHSLLLLPLLYSLPTQAADNAKPLNGADIFHDNCSVCHGDRGDGNSRAKNSFYPAPRNFTAPQAATELTRERMIFSVTYGRPNTAMAGWGRRLGEERVAAVVDYIRSSFMQLEQAEAEGTLARESVESDIVKGDSFDPEYMNKPMPLGLAGVPGWGRIFYNANCAVCHGESGDGKGPRAYFILPKPRDYRHPAARHKLNRPRLFEVIAQGSHGSEMPAWDKVLTYQEIAHVSEYIFQAFIKPEEEPTTTALAE